MDKQDSLPQFRERLYATKRQWNQFLSIFLLAAGVGFAVCGVIFFFAYNWADLPKFVKLTIPQLGVVVFVLLSLFTRRKFPVSQILLMGAVFLVGACFAVFGQIYQTGADAYDLFLGWTVFVFLWALADRYAPLWLVFLGLLFTTIWLYTVQIVPNNLLSTSILLTSVTWIGAIATIIAERMRIIGKLNKRSYWFANFMGVFTIVYASYVLITGIFDVYTVLSLPLITTIILFAVGLWFGRRKKNLLYFATILFAILIIFLFVLVKKNDMPTKELFLLCGIYTIIGTTALIYAILKLKKKWYGTEE